LRLKTGTARFRNWIGAGALALAAGLFVPSAGFAQTETAPKPSKFRTTAILDVGSNLYSVDSEEHSASSSLVLLPSYRLTPDWTLGLALSTAKDLTGMRQLTFFDPSVRIQHSALKLNPYISLTPTVGVIVPASERSRERESLITAIRSSLRFVGDLSRLRKPVIRDVSVVNELAVSRAFHQFETSTTGSVNTAWRLSNWLSLGYNPESPWSVSADFIRNTGWSYQGGMRHSFSLGETLSYQVDPRFSISVGHTNEGDVLRANGLSSNIQIFDSTSSRVFTSFTVIF
jgi:hypothetical protein